MGSPAGQTLKLQRSKILYVHWLRMAAFPEGDGKAAINPAISPELTSFCHLLHGKDLVMLQ
jgi:hypothetical protein